MHWQMDLEFCLSIVFFALRLQTAISESGGTTEWLFANFVEQRCCKKICGAIIQGEAESGKSDQVAEIVGDLFEIGGATSGRVVPVLAGRLDRDLPLTADGFYMRIAKKIHCQVGLLGAWRKEILLRRGRPRRVKGKIGSASKVCEEFEQGFAVGLQGALSDQRGIGRGRRGINGKRSMK